MKIDNEIFLLTNKCDYYRIHKQKSFEINFRKTHVALVQLNEKIFARIKRWVCPRGRFLPMAVQIEAHERTARRERKSSKFKSHLQIMGRRWVRWQSIWSDLTGNFPNKRHLGSTLGQFWRQRALWGFLQLDGCWQWNRWILKNDSLRLSVQKSLTLKKLLVISIMKLSGSIMKNMINLLFT